MPPAFGPHTVMRPRTSVRASLPAVSALDPLSIVSSVPSVFFLSGDVGVTLDTGVSNWADQSGNGRDAAQATTGKQPAYDAAGLNDRGTLTFDGVDDVLAMGYIPPAPGTTPSWYWLVINPITSATGATIQGSNNTNRHRLYWSNTSLLSFYNGTTNLQGAISTGAWYRCALNLSNSTSDYRQVGSSSVGGSNAGNNAGFSGLYLGALAATGGGAANVEVAAWGCWAGEPTPGEKAALDQWATAYYGAGVQV